MIAYYLRMASGLYITHMCQSIEWGSLSIYINGALKHFVHMVCFFPKETFNVPI